MQARLFQWCSLFNGNTIHNFLGIWHNLVTFTATFTKEFLSPSNQSTSRTYWRNRGYTIINIEVSVNKLGSLLHILRSMITSHPSQGICGYSRWGSGPKQVDLHSSVNRNRVKITILPPQVSQQVLVTRRDHKLVVHFLDVTSESKRFEAKSEQNPQQHIYQIRTL